MSSKVRVLLILAVFGTGFPTASVYASVPSKVVGHKRNIMQLTINQANPLAETEYTIDGVTHQLILATQEVPNATATNPNKISGIEEHILFLVDEAEVADAPYKTVWKSYWKRYAGMAPTPRLWASLIWDSARSSAYLTVVETAGSGAFYVRVYSVDPNTAVDSYPYTIDMDDSSWAHRAQAIAEDRILTTAGKLGTLSTSVSDDVLHISASSLELPNRPCFKIDCDLSNSKLTRIDK